MLSKWKCIYRPYLKLISKPICPQPHLSFLIQKWWNVQQWNVQLLNEKVSQTRCVNQFEAKQIFTLKKFTILVNSIFWYRDKLKIFNNSKLIEFNNVVQFSQIICRLSEISGKQRAASNGKRDCLECWRHCGQNQRA